jgi:hypothetical protein
MKDKINHILEKYPDVQWDSKFVACSEEHERETIKNSPIIKGFLKEFDIQKVNFNKIYTEVCNEYWKMKNRKEFYRSLMLKLYEEEHYNIEI